MCLLVAVVGEELVEQVVDILRRMLEVVDSPWERRHLKAEHRCFVLERKDLGARVQM